MKYITAMAVNEKAIKSPPPLNISEIRAEADTMPTFLDVS